MSNDVWTKKKSFRITFISEGDVRGVEFTLTLLDDVITASQHYNKYDAKADNLRKVASKINEKLRKKEFKLVRIEEVSDL